MTSKFKSKYFFLTITLKQHNKIDKNIFLCIKADEIAHQVNSLSKHEATMGFNINVNCSRILDTKKQVINLF